MKKTNFLYASAFMVACSFGVLSCAYEDNPAPQVEPQPEPEPQPVLVEEVTTYDFAAIPDGTKLGNLGGSAANGQSFYGWEKADKTDSKRQDYKGYKLVEGVNLPEVCHVWVRSDRFDQDNSFKNGGLNIRNDREMAIDGLSAGSIVQITYDPGVKEVSVEITPSLNEVPFYNCEGTYGADAKKENTAGFAWVIGESTDMPYGDGNVINFADLSAYTKLIVTTTEGTPRFLFNRDEKEGQWNENEADSHLIDNTKGGWSAKYFTSEEKDGVTTWTVDLALLVQDKGFAHLHAIKGGNWQNCTVTSMTLVGTKKETEPLDNKLLWAIGDGSSTEGLGVRATAELEGIDEAVITGQTEIASGVNIKVKSVTPADNGSGYIVVKVKKGMIIKKIVITNFVEKTDDVDFPKGDFIVDQKFTSLNEIGTTPFAIINVEEMKALYGPNNQNLNYGDITEALNKSNANIGFKLEALEGGNYLLRAITPAGEEYGIWGSPGYLNTQPANQTCCFILGLNNQNGQDFENGAVWEIQYVDGKGFSLKNIGTGLYLKDNTPAKYEEPTYFGFYSYKENTEAQ